MKHQVEFKPSGRGKAQCDPDPNFPDGIDIEVGNPLVSCKVDIPYPAPECGLWIVRCEVCGFSMALTAAGRPDDPRSVRLPCAIPSEVQ